MKGTGISRRSFPSPLQKELAKDMGVISFHLLESKQSPNPLASWVLYHDRGYSLKKACGAFSAV